MFCNRPANGSASVEHRRDPARWRRGYDDCQQQPQRIHEAVVLAPVDVLARIVPPNARHRRAFDTLAVQATRRRVLVPTALSSQPQTRGMIEARPRLVE